MRLFTITLLLAFLSIHLYSQQCSPIFQCGSLPVSGGTPPGSPTFFCEGDTVIIENNAQNDVDSTFIDWGDNIVEHFGGRVNGSHIYDLIDTLCLSGGDTLTSIPITLTVLKKCPAGISRNCVITFVSIQVKPTVRFSNIDPLCVNKPIKFRNTTCQNGAMATYLWTFDNGPTSTDKEPTFTFTTAGLHKVRLCATNNCGTNCVERSFLIRAGATISNVAVTKTPDPACAPAVVKFKPTFKDVNDWTWSVLPPPGCIGCWDWVNSTADSLEPSVRFKKIGDYTMRLIVTNECGADTLDTPVTIVDVPTVAFAQNSLSGCNTLTVNFGSNNLVTYGGSVDTYSWKFPDGSTSDQPFPTQTFNQSGTVQLIVNGPCGKDTAQIAINISQQVPVQFGPIPGPLCQSSDTFSIPVLVTQNPHLFSGTGIANPQTGLFDPSKAMLGPNVITYTQGAPGCATTGTLTIDILPGATVDVGGPVSLCVNAGLYTIVFNPAGGQWTGAGIANGTLGTFDPALAKVGSNELTYTYTDPNTGCVSVRKKTIDVVALPTGSVVPDTLSTCDIPTPVDLKKLATISFSPGAAGNTTTFSGPGVTPDGFFTSPGLGVFQLSVKYSIPPGCDVSLDFWVRVDSFIDADAGAAQQVCKSQGNLTLNGFPSGQGTWMPIGGAPAIGTKTGVIDLTTAAAGDWLYRYTIRAGTPCESSDTVAVKIEPSNGVQSSPFVYACDTELSAMLPAATPVNGAWTNGNGIPINGSQIDISNLPPGDYPFVYTVSALPLACNHDTTHLVIAPDVNPAFSASQDTVCLGLTSIQFTPAVAGQGEYHWDFGDGTSSDLESPSKTYTAAGDFTVTLTVRSKNPVTQNDLCKESSTHSIHVIAAPQAVAATAMPKAGCGPLKVTFTNQSVAENGTYWWDFGNGDPVYSGFEPGAPITYLQGREDTTYTAYLLVSNGCDTIEFPIEIIVHPQPTPLIEYSYQKPCSGEILVLTNHSYGQPDSSSWRDSEGWVFGGQDPPVRQYFTGDSLPKVVTIWLTVQNGCGTKTDSVQVTVNPADVFATAYVSDTSKVCLGDTVRLKNISPDGTPRWVDKNGQEWATPEIAIVASDTGLYWLTLYVYGCGYDSVTLYYYVHPLPTLAVAPPAVICPDMPASFQVLSNAPATLFSFGTGDTTALQAAQHVYTQPGPYNLWAQATSLFGCVAQWTGNIEVRKKPEAIPVVPDSVCSGVEIQLGGQQTGTNYTCIFLLPNGETADGCPTSYTFPQGGTFSISLVLVDSAGCRDTADAPVYVRQSPVGGFTYNILNHCTPAQVQVQSTASGATDVDWTTGDGGTYSTFSFGHTYQTGGSWPVTQTVTNEGLCPVTVTQTLKIDQTPVFDFTLDKQCFVALGTDLSINTAFDNWVLVQGDTSGYEQAGNFHQGLLADRYHIFIKSPENCAHDTTLTILPVNELLLRLKNDRDSFTIQLGESVELSAQVNQTGVSVAWTNDLGDLVDTVLQTSVMPTRPTFFIITATNAAGCAKQDTVYVNVLISRDSVLVPNAFTPDGSGKNDIFRIRTTNTGIQEVRNFRIWDKWGELVFEKEHFDPGAPHGWDGDFRGKKAEAGVYIYRIQVDYIDGFSYEKRGEVLLIR